MADPKEKWEDNIKGKWYTDKTCILCSVCADVAPECFKESTTGDHDVVFRQPTTPDEEKLCQEALEQCPVNAIGNDGDTE